MNTCMLWWPSLNLDQLQGSKISPELLFSICGTCITSGTQAAFSGLREIYTNTNVCLLNLLSV